jgi:hypothetical protein
MHRGAQTERSNRINGLRALVKHSDAAKRIEPQNELTPELTPPDNPVGGGVNA